ncbi:4610_t:CDS:2 [Funneliformis caledonium]|uniref:4610_t:CDS:1 n=2 Tax=Funneliformis TaxID=1117308 RepID=A0A9N9DXK3_9GLOM|nr:13985_t:CDS:2 [Funneliformis mosseae]CAG8656667.1 4610_t:CDS:2 [Funneliformis caledonium]
MSNKSVEDWEAQLVGKKFVRGNMSISAEEQDKVVRETDLPAGHRVVPPDAMVTMDFKPDRLNVYIDHSSIVTSVKFG